MMLLCVRVCVLICARVCLCACVRVCTCVRASVRVCLRTRMRACALFTNHQNDNELMIYIRPARTPSLAGSFVQIMSARGSHPMASGAMPPPSANAHARLHARLVNSMPSDAKETAEMKKEKKGKKEKKEKKEKKVRVFYFILCLCLSLSSTHHTHTLTLDGKKQE